MGDRSPRWPRALLRGDARAVALVVVVATLAIVLGAFRGGAAGPGADGRPGAASDALGVAPLSGPASPDDEVAVAAPTSVGNGVPVPSSSDVPASGVSQPPVPPSFPPLSPPPAAQDPVAKAPTGPASSKAGGAPSTAAGPRTRVATRVVVPALGIDLPVIRQRHSFPECNVAMYLRQLRQPGQGRATYLYAHARTGMFLPLLTRSRVNGGASMIGMRVLVYTGDSRLFVYRIARVYRHATSLSRPLSARSEQLWLQTSEGPHGTIPKLQVRADPVSAGPAPYAAAHPRPQPILCH
jgi:hypothetical protein